MAWWRRHLDLLVATTFGLATSWILAGELSRSFDYDEGVSVAFTISQGSATVPFTESTVFNTHPVFASVQSLWWAWAGEGEARQRALPILYGALAVALLGGWVTRRLGVLAGVAAAAVLMLNPMFVTQSRAVRGYSLATLAVVVGMVSLVEYVRREQVAVRSGSLLLLAIHAAAVVVALGTHLFSGIALGAIGVGSLVVLRRFDVRVWIAWLSAGFGVLAVYYWTFEELRATTEQRGTDFKPWFARVATWEVLGTDRLTGTVIAALAFVGVGLLVSGRVTRRRGVAPAVVVVVALVIAQAWFVWQIAQPYDLYPRFFLTVVPLVAVAAAVAIGRLPWLAPLLVIGLLATWGNVATVRRSSSPVREVADIVRAAEDRGLQSCAIGSWPLRAYGVYLREPKTQVDDLPGQLRGCDVFVLIGGWGGPLVEPARDRFDHVTTVGTFEVFSVVPIAELAP